MTTLETEIELGLYMTLILLSDIVHASLARSVRVEVIILGSSKHTMKAVFGSREGGKAVTKYLLLVCERVSGSPLLRYLNNDYLG